MAHLEKGSDEVYVCVDSLGECFRACKMYKNEGKNLLFMPSLTVHSRNVNDRHTG